MGLRTAPLTSLGDEFAWSLLDAGPDATLIVADSGEIVFANDRTAELFGCALTDLLGKVVEDLLPEASQAVHRAHRTRYRAEPTARSIGEGLDLEARRPDGSAFPVEIALSPVHLGDDVFTVAVVRETTDRLHAEEHLHRVLGTLDASDDGVFIFDTTTLLYSFVNDGAVRLVGYGRDELLTMGPLHLSPHGTEADYRGIIADLLERPSMPVVRQAALMRKDGVEVAVEKTYQSAPAARDGTHWVITLSRDITERLATEARLRVSHEALQEAEQVVAIANDRERIARDLHDTVIQRLFGEGLHLQAAMGGADPPMQARLQSTIDGLDQTIRDLRMTIFSLQGAGSAPGGLRGRLLEAVTAAAEGLGFDPRLQFDGPIETIDDHIADQLLPVLRESLSNITRHAHAHHVRVVVAVDHHVTMTVTDDGVGGIAHGVLGGRGLKNLADRATGLDGTCTLNAPDAGGSQLTWRVPVGAVTPVGTRATAGQALPTNVAS